MKLEKHESRGSLDVFLWLVRAITVKIIRFSFSLIPLFGYEGDHHLTHLPADSTLKSNFLQEVPPNVTYYFLMVVLWQHSEFQLKVTLPNTDQRSSLFYGNLINHSIIHLDFCYPSC